MSAATIVFTDIVNFSGKSTVEQRQLIESVTAELTPELRTLLAPPLDTPSLVALPTGDGVALAFLHRPNKPWDRSTILRVILRLHQWAHRQYSPAHSVGLRVGVHVGAVELVTDINGKANVCGDTINYAQRVMDAAGPRQTLFSETAFGEYVGADSPVFVTPPFSEALKASFCGPIEVYGKHELQMLVYKLVLKPPQLYWSNEDPAAKHLMLVSLTPLPKKVVGSFSEHVQQATQIAFIQLTGDRFIASFDKGNIKFSKQLKRFWVFMPDPQMYAGLHLTEPQAFPKLVRQCVGKWQDFFAKLRSQFTKADFKLGLFKEPPYLGASFIDWEQPGGRIHVSPYVWNVAAPNCPGYDLCWLGRKPSPIYETYVEGLQYLHQSTQNALAK